MLLIFLLLISISLAQFSYLPDCQAISPTGLFFDWTPLANLTLNSPYFIANICGKSVWPCGDRNCPFCGAKSGICEGYNIPNSKGRWVASSPEGGVVVYCRGECATINMNCDPQQETPIVSGGKERYPYALTFTAKSACPIGMCEGGGCNYNKGWGSCLPEKKFTCACNVGFKGIGCNESTINPSLTVNRGNYKNGFIAGGKAWISFIYFDNVGQIVPCSARIPLGIDPMFNENCIDFTNERNFTLTGTKSGVHEIKGTLFGNTVAGAPFYYVVSPAASNYLYATATGQGLHTAIVHRNTTFQIQLADQYQNNVVECPFEITNNYIGSLFGVSAAQVYFTCNLGVLTGTYHVTVPGLYQLTVKFQNKVAPQFPLQVIAQN